VSDRKYLYQGPPSGVTLKDGREVLLWPGVEVTLPSDNRYVQRLVAKKLLAEPVAEQRPARTQQKRVRAPKQSPASERQPAELAPTEE
jgi:hypothetical protein